MVGGIFKCNYLRLSSTVVNLLHYLPAIGIHVYVNLARVLIISFVSLILVGDV